MIRLLDSQNSRLPNLEKILLVLISCYLFFDFVTVPAEMENWEQMKEKNKKRNDDDNNRTRMKNIFMPKKNDKKKAHVWIKIIINEWLRWTI